MWPFSRCRHSWLLEDAVYSHDSYMGWKVKVRLSCRKCGEQTIKQNDFVKLVHKAEAEQWAQARETKVISKENKQEGI